MSIRNRYLIFSKIYLRLDLKEMTSKGEPDMETYRSHMVDHRLCLTDSDLYHKRFQALIDFSEHFNNLCDNSKSVYTGKILKGDIESFLQNENFIIYLACGDQTVGWVWIDCSDSILLEGDEEPIGLNNNQVYVSRFFIRPRHLFRRNKTYISHRWIQALSKIGIKRGYSEAVAYVDRHNKGALKSFLKSGFLIDCWVQE